MLKKIIIACLSISALIVALPLIGNTSLKSTIDKRIQAVEAAGISIKKDDSKSNYFNTNIHYEFTVSDKDKLNKYLSDLSQQQIPPYLSAVLDGSTISSDISYFNIPLVSNIDIDIYPAQLSKLSYESLAKDDKDFATQVTKLVKNKAFLYHISYGVAAQEFSGYLKNIDETVKMKDGTAIKFTIADATFSGKGNLMEPKSIDSYIKNLSFEITNPKLIRVNFSIDEAQTSSIFSSKNSYNSQVSLKKMKFSSIENSIKTALLTNAIKIDASSVDDGNKISTTTDISFNAFNLDSPMYKANIKELVMNVSTKDIDSKGYRQLQNSYYNASSQDQNEMMLAANELMSKGFKLNINEFSAATLKFNDLKQMKGFNHKLNLTLKPDPDFMKKAQTSPMALKDDLALDASFRFSQEFYDFISGLTPAAQMANNFIKKEGDEVVFNITLKDGSLDINGVKL